jgi:hypothetical protein
VVTGSQQIERQRAEKFRCACVHGVSWDVENRNACVFNDLRRHHSPLTLATLITEEYNMIKHLVRGGAGGLHNDIRE